MRDDDLAHDHVLIAHHMPLGEGVLPSPIVVATITTDARILGHVNAPEQLRILAAKMGLVDFEISTSDARRLPYYQQQLPFRSR